MAERPIPLSIFNSEMKSLGKVAVHWAIFGVCFMATIEMASRIDQWWAYGAPIFGVYTYDTALFATDDFGIHGRPNGHYEKWHLNGFGFRSDEITLEKPPDRLRIACIGASETFGFYEKPGNEWPRRLEQGLLNEGIEAEVINAAIAGMSLPQRVQHLKNRLLRFQPDVVIVMLEYGSYAGLTREVAQARKHALPSVPDRQNLVEGLKSIRVVSRLKDVVLPQLPSPLQEAVGKLEKTFKKGLVKRELGARYGSFVHVKPFEVDALKFDVEGLSDLTRAAGVQLILVSPAMWFTEENLFEIALSWPYIDEAWWRDAQGLLPSVTKEIAQRRNLPYLDLSEIVRGREEEFMRDFLHFSDRGAEEVARHIANQVIASKPPQGSLQ
jgi:lysophospholipase L1-like esterase